MRRLRLFTLVFLLALAGPMAYFVFHTQRGLEKEEMAELKFFADTLFDTMERSLAEIVIREEARAIDEYQATLGGVRSVGLSSPQEGPGFFRPPPEPYVLGYLQNNPDGSVQIPWAGRGEASPRERQEEVDLLNEVNRVLNLKRFTVPEPAPPRPTAPVRKQKEGEAEKGLAGKYLDLSRSARQRGFLGQDEKRVEQLPRGKTLSMAQGKREQNRADAAPPEQETAALDELDEKDRSEQRAGSEALAVPAAPKSAASILEPEPTASGSAASETARKAAGASESPPSGGAKGLRVEVDPLQSVFIDDQRIFLFRRIVIDSDIYRQGMVIVVREFMEHLIQSHFVGQPMARFTGLSLSAWGQGRETARVQGGELSEPPRFSLERNFPRPFGFLRATLTAAQIPQSRGRRTLLLMGIVLAGIVLIGLFAIYQSARVVLDHSERRARFVSSVTHELKTPLTNIRMYVEMLEQGMARSPERESEYYRILGSESARLSRLINNVLEFSKLETRQRRLELKEGTFDEVVREAEEIMRERIFQEGFCLRVQKEEMPPVLYDREALVQILINLLENSVKFGKGSPLREITVAIRREGERAAVSVSDQGPGIPREALKRVFDDFYRAETALTQTTQGTGIGLALVRKLANAMGGSVRAANNQGPGCTITVSLPLRR